MRTKHCFATLILLLQIIGSIPTADAQETPKEFPKFFPWITDTVYISSSAPDGGDGSVESPFNNWEDFSFNNKTAYLFKRGGAMDVPGQIAIRADSIFFGGYGRGARPLFNGKGTAKNLYFLGNHVYIQGINVACKDTGTCISFRGFFNSTPEEERHKFAMVDSVELSHSWWGIEPGCYGKIILSNLYVHRIRVDGIYSSHCDTLIVRNSRVHDVNRWFDWIQDINTSGGDCLQCVDNDYVEIDRCDLDHSDTPGKYALIITGADSMVIKNSKLTSYDETAAFYVGSSTSGCHVEGTKFIGGKYGLWNHGKLVVKNCVFKNNWLYAIYYPTGVICNTVFADNPGGREYLVPSKDPVTGETIYVTRKSTGLVLPFSGKGNKAQVFNNIFYNVNQAFQVNSDLINKDIIIYNNDYYNNPEEFEKQPKNQFGANVLNVDPKFDTSKGDTTDFYLSAGSPLIDAGIAPSTFGVTLTTDINGNARPYGDGYDIGVYEYSPTNNPNDETDTSLKFPYSQEQDVVVFPNPTKGDLHLKSESDLIERVEVFSIDGRKVLDVESLNTNEYHLNLTGFDSKIYIVKVYLENSTYSTKVLKK
jgi:hypothetical protein